MNLTIKQRLLLSNVVTLAFVAIVGTIGVFAVRALDVSMDAISANGAAMKHQMQADQAHDALRADVIAAQLASTTGNAEEQEAARKDVAAHAALLKRNLVDMAAKTTDPALLQAMAQVRPDAEAYAASAIEMVRLADRDGADSAARSAAFTQLFRKLETSMGALSELIENDSDEALAAGDDVVVGARGQIIGISLLSMLITLGVGLAISRSIVRPLDEVIAFAAGVAGGDLDDSMAAAPNDHSETGKLKTALNEMRTSLHGIVRQVREGTDSIVTASGEIAAGNLDLSTRTEMQASTLEETASSMEELTATVRQNADNARQGNVLATSASEVAVKGGEVVARVVETMGAIDGASRKIVEIIDVIEGIAFQTNILALNAAVEAARAGEQGRGFAVVAAEVRSLAQRSNTAAHEIKQLIGASVQQVTLGSTLVGEAGATMEQILSSVRRVTDIMSEIAAASGEQDAGIMQVNQAIATIDTATQQNAALVEEAAAAAGAMREQANGLERLVSVFKLGAAGSAPQVQPRSTSRALISA